MKIVKFYYFIGAVIACSLFNSQTAQALNSNEWTPYTSVEHGFRMSYPPSWKSLPTKGHNVKISVSPTDGPGNCNVVMQNISEIDNYTQDQLNALIKEMPLNVETWANLLSMESSQFSIIEQKRAKANKVSVISGTLEVELESIKGKYFRKANSVFMFTPGKRWAITCGVSTYKSVNGRQRYKQLAPYLDKIMESFIFINNDGTIGTNDNQQKKSPIETIASQIAKEHNDNAKTMIDSMTLSTSAKADRSNVIITNVLRIKKGLSKQELEQYQAGLYDELVPIICQQNIENKHLDKGLSYTAIYYNNYKEKLAEIMIDKSNCVKR